VRVAFPTEAFAYRYGILSRHELARIQDAIDLQRASETLFSDQIWPFLAGAQLAETAHDAIAAERYLLDVCDRFPDSSNGWLELAAFRQRGGRLEADVIDAALERFPHDPEILVLHAQLARSAGMWDEARRRWESAKLRFPDHPAIANGFAVSPVDTPRNKRPDVAQARYRELQRQLRREGDLGRAEELACTAIAHLRRTGRHTEAVLELSKIKTDQGELDAARRVFSDFVAEMPNLVAAYLELSAILSRQGRLEEAEAVCTDAISRFRFRVGPFIEYANLAVRRGDKVAALERWNRAATLAPRSEAVRTGMFITRLALAEDRDASLSADVGVAVGQEQQRGTVANILMQFESLGGPGGGGCEFGLVQRNFGAEPIGLLRWASVDTTALIAALQSRFEGIGTAEQTLVEPPGAARRDFQYYVRDLRFGMQMHTFAYQGEIEVEKLHQQWCARLTFMRRKFIADLEAGKRIFVFRPGIPVDDVTIDRLASAIREYGESFLLVIQTATDVHRSGLVRVVSPSVMIGYLDRLNWTPSGAPHQPSYSAWAQVCSSALSLARELRGVD
jgi:tetratricopeptide (TPR) repeat protein